MLVISPTQAYSQTIENINQRSPHLVNMIVYPDRVARGDKGRTNGCGSDLLNLPQLQSIPAQFQAIVNSLDPLCDNAAKCYASCNETKATCDKEFRGLLRNKCNKEISRGLTSPQTTCHSTVELVYERLKSLGNIGGFSFLDIQSSSCGCPDHLGSVNGGGLFGGLFQQHNHCVGTTK